MHVVLWLIALLGALAGGAWILMTFVLALGSAVSTSTDGMAGFAMLLGGALTCAQGMALAVVPYVIARAYDEIVGRR